MQLKRQLFRPGRRIDQIGKLGAHPFFTRRKATALAAPPEIAMSASKRPVLARIAENLGALFSIAISLVLTVAIVALLVAFIRDIRRDAFELDVFSAPRAIAERGYTSTPIAEAMLDEIRAIQGEAFTLQSRRSLEVAGALPDVQVGGGGLSMKAIVRYARRLFDLPDNRISGELLQDGNAVKLALRIREGTRTRLVVVRRNDGDVDRLLRDAGRAIVQIADPYLLAVYLFGREAKAGSFAETRAAIDHVLAHGRATDRPSAYGMLGKIERIEGRPEQALAAYRRFAELDANAGTQALVAQLVRMDRDSEALALARDHAARAASADDFMAVASMMESLGRYGDELDYARRALGRDPKGAEAHNSVANALLDLHRSAEALAIAQRGWKLNPDDRDLPSTIAYQLIQVGRPVEALDICNAALAVWPGDLWCREMRGNAYAALGRQNDAIAEYRYAQENGNASSFLATDFGNLLLAMGRTNDALAQYQLALATSPRHWAPNVGWARAQLALGRPQFAAERLAATAKYDLDDALLFREWARALDALGRTDEANAKRDEAKRIEARLKIPLAD